MVNATDLAGVVGTRGSKPAQLSCQSGNAIYIERGRKGEGGKGGRVRGRE